MKIIIFCIVLFMTGCSSFHETSNIQVLPLLESSSQVESLETEEQRETIEETKFVFEEREIPDEGLLVPYESDRQVYMTCKNWDLDVYNDIYTEDELCFSIYSVEALKEEMIQVKIPIQTSYTVEIQEIVMGEYVTPHLYVSYQGMNWKLAQIMYEKMKLAYERNELLEQEKNKISIYDEAKRMEINAEIRDLKLLLEAYDQYVKQYKGTWSYVLSKKSPKFYRYEVSISFDDMKEEEFKKIHVKIGDNQYIQEVGCVRLHEKSTFDVYGRLSYKTIETSYDGTNVIEIPISVPKNTSKDTIILNQLQIEDEHVKLLGANIEITLADGHVISFNDGGEVTTFQIGTNYYVPWNTKDALTIENATFITVIAYVQDERKEQLEYKNNGIITLDYEREEFNGREKEPKAYTIKRLYQLEQINNGLEVCATVFHGVNVMDYYKYYEHHYYGWNVTEAGIVMTKQNQEDAYFEELHKKFY